MKREGEVCNVKKSKNEIKLLNPEEVEIRRYNMGEKTA